jgi:hypothetical protein
MMSVDDGVERRGWVGGGGVREGRGGGGGWPTSIDWEDDEDAGLPISDQNQRRNSFFERSERICPLSLLVLGPSGRGWNASTNANAKTIRCKPPAIEPIPRRALEPNPNPFGRDRLPSSSEGARTSPTRRTLRLSLDCVLGRGGGVGRGVRRCGLVVGGGWWWERRGAV